MAEITWDAVGQRYYETGVDHGVLYSPDQTGAYNEGVPWNGLVSVTESPSGAEPQPQYADNMKYINLMSAEEFGGTIEAFMYPDEFGKHDGTASPAPGIFLGQQLRRPFGMSYRTLVGNDVDGMGHGYKLHLVYGALAAPSEKGYTTVNDSPEAMTFSWEFTTTSVEVGLIGGVRYKPAASLTVDSREVPAAALAALEQILYGTAEEEPRLPLPGEVIQLLQQAE